VRELGNGIQAWRILQQALEGGDVCGLQMGADYRDQPLLFRRQRLANQLLQHGIARGHETLRGQEVPEFSDDIHGFGTDPGGLLGFDR
jgi:hypothetical protein